MESKLPYVILAVLVLVGIVGVFIILKQPAPIESVQNSQIIAANQPELSVPEKKS